MLDNDRCTKRACKSRAEQSIHAQCKKYSPRGNPKAAEASGSPPSTLYRIFQDDKPTFSAGMGCINSYMQRNTSMEIQKAFPISVMGTAMTRVGMQHNRGSCCTSHSRMGILVLQVIRITPENVTDGGY